MKFYSICHFVYFVIFSDPYLSLLAFGQPFQHMSIVTFKKGWGVIDEIDKVIVTPPPPEFGATHFILNGDNFCFS